MLPRLSCAINDQAHGIVAYLVIHNRIDGRSMGGVRLVPSIDRKEMQASAITMTHKFGFIGFPMGGAKCAIQISDNLRLNKTGILRSLGESLSPLLKTRAYIPVTDMNSTADNIREILRGAGIKPKLSGWKNISHVYTAYSCYISTLAALEARGVDVSNATYAVQGFGKVASEYVKLMTRSGAKLIGLSNRVGAIANENGLDSNDLLKQRGAHGEGFIAHYPAAEAISHEQIFKLPVTILLPAARAWAIHENNREDVRAPMVICASNAAMDDHTERWLFEHDKLVVPDFVANCGGVLGSILEHKVNQNFIFDLMETTYKKKVAQLLTASAQRSKSMVVLAKKEAQDNIALWDEHKNSWLSGIYRRLRNIAPEKHRNSRYAQFYSKLWRAK